MKTDPRAACANPQERFVWALAHDAIASRRTGCVYRAWRRLSTVRDRRPIHRQGADVNAISEPLPCPFCGSAAKWSHHASSRCYYGIGPDRVYRWQSSLSCTGCGLPHCSGFGEVKYESGNALAHQYAMKDAIRQWNRRSFPALTNTSGGRDVPPSAQ